MEKRTIKAIVPASTANLGPGFDCLGLALALYNTVELQTQPGEKGWKVSIDGEGASDLPSNEKNLIVQAMLDICKKTGKNFPGVGIHLKATNAIPLSSGLGSSAAAIVSGLVVANSLLETRLTPRELLQLAARREGHPDNVAAALFGGLTAAGGAGPTGGNDNADVVELDVDNLQVVIALPNVRLSTAEARKVLPEKVPFQDAVANMRNSLFVIQALQQGDFEVLKWAMKDRLHEPYRQSLIPGYQKVCEAAYEKGAAAVVLSGAGPSLAAFAPEHHAAIAEAMKAAFESESVSCRTFILPVDQKGAQVKFL